MRPGFSLLPTERERRWVSSHVHNFADSEQRGSEGWCRNSLRHANSRIRLDLYAQAGAPNKRQAQSKLVRMVLNRGEALA